MQSHFYSAVWSQLTNTVTLSDTVNLPTPCRWLLVLAAWNVVFNALSSWPDWTVTTHTMTWAWVWTIIPCIITRVFTSWTSATVAAMY